MRAGRVDVDIGRCDLALVVADRVRDRQDLVGSAPPRNVDPDHLSGRIALALGGDLTASSFVDELGSQRERASRAVDVDVRRRAEIVPGAIWSMNQAGEVDLPFASASAWPVAERRHHAAAREGQRVSLSGQVALPGVVSSSVLSEFAICATPARGSGRQASAAGDLGKGKAGAVEPP